MVSRPSPKHTAELSIREAPSAATTANTATSDGSLSPLVVLVGATGSGKTTLSLTLAEELAGEIVSCDSVAVYRGLDIGSAKPTPEERLRVPHHLIDVVWPDEAFTAGDYARLAREALTGITERGRLPLITGGTGLYLRALLDGLFPAPPTDPKLRTRLQATAQRRGANYLHRLLARRDTTAATRIHPNDVPKIVRALEVSFAAGSSITAEWQKGRNGLQGYNILRLGLAPERSRLYERIDCRCAAMFESGLVVETATIAAQYGDGCRALTSLGYAQALAVLHGEMPLGEALAQTQQGHRNYAKRQGTWFRREPAIHWLQGTGDDPQIQQDALQRIRNFLAGPVPASGTRA
jgi:tRNA dimethylallyltransferase